MSDIAVCEDAAREAVEHFNEAFNTVRQEVSKFIVGQEETIENVLIAIIAGGHVLLEGVPGLGKTALVQTLAQAADLKFKRIQFTPDLLPADLLGTNIVVDRNGHKEFEFQHGPVFTNILLADEINRATPKTQSALLETMQEKTVTVGGTTHSMELPYFVLATQNPIEMDGTYPLPEAQLDRFFFKLNVEMPKHDEVAEILLRTAGISRPEIKPVLSGEDLLRMEQSARQVPVDKDVQDYLIRIVMSTHPENENAPAAAKSYLRYGASPRAAQAILTAARIRALLKQRYHVSNEDIQAVAIPALRHRMILNFEGEAEGLKTDTIIRDIMKQC